MIEEPNPEPELLRVESISVEGLFGLYDHTIPLDLDDRVTIIHGPNGVGKTKILEWVDALFRLDISKFTRVPFSRFTVRCTKGAMLEIESTIGPSATIHHAPQDTGSEAATVFIVRGKNRVGIEHEFNVSLQAARLLETLSKTEKVVRTNINSWYDLESGKVLSTQQAIMTHALGQAFSIPKNLEPPLWFGEIANDVDITIIETDRLAARASVAAVRRGQLKTIPPAVEACAMDLRDTLREGLAEYGSISQSLDQTFAQKLIQYSQPVTDIGELKNRMIALDETRDRYAKLGLLEEGGATHPFDVNAIDALEGEKKTILAVYVENTEEKLATLTDLADRIEMLLDSINGKFSNKHLSVNTKSGMVVRDDRGNSVKLSALSSGEQHELVLIYDLLFNSEPNTLVLIDEPELSLHITWQKRFLDDLLQIAKLVGIDALVATHSPFIIGEREDLMVALDASPTHRARP